MVDGEVGVAVSVTVSVLPKPPLEQLPEDVPPVLVQLSVPEPPLDATVPPPLPEKASDTTLLSVKVFCACKPDWLPWAVK